MNTAPIIGTAIFLVFAGFSAYMIYLGVSSAPIEGTDILDLLVRISPGLLFLALTLFVGLPFVAWLFLPDPTIKNNEIAITLWWLIPPVKKFRMPLGQIEELRQVREKDQNAFMDSRNPNIEEIRKYDGKPVFSLFYDRYVTKKLKRKTAPKIDYSKHYFNTGGGDNTIYLKAGEYEMYFPVKNPKKLMEEYRKYGG